MAKETVKIDRRGFMGGAAAILAALGWEGRAVAEGVGERLPAWRPGELELHFIYTGCGENMFYRLPDGTAILNDTGDFYRPKDLSEVPLLPSSERLGGDWVSRYIRRVYDGKEIDYALFSHWHTDHVGHAMFDGTKTPRGDYRYRVNAKGEKINGFLCVAEDFRILRCLDQEYPKRGSYGTQSSAMKLLCDWEEREVPKGLAVEPFDVGALDQIRMQRDPKRYKGLFSIRNLCANGVIWDGGSGKTDYAAEQAVTDYKSPGWIGQNDLSMGFVMRYGRFSYLTTGDMHGHVHTRLDGTTLKWDALVASLAGKVSVCKMSHHGCKPDMSLEMLKAARADAYVGCMWCPRQSHPEAMDRMIEAAGDGPRPIILPQLMTDEHREWLANHGYGASRPKAVHVVVKVEPGGGAYRIHLVDAGDEEMRVVATFPVRCS